MIPTEVIGDGSVFASERCCFCHQATCRWTDLDDRTPGQQVACCLACSWLREPSEVPSKDEWFDSERTARQKTCDDVAEVWPGKRWQR